jgi:hypothetical protein
MKLLKTTITIILTVFLTAKAGLVFAHGPVYETKELEGNKLRIVLKLNSPENSKGIVIAYYHLKNAKDLNIGYELKEGAAKSTYLDYSLNSAVPPIRITLTDINNADGHPFGDIKGLETEQYIRHLHDAGIINGRTGNFFKPKDTITRAEFMVLMVKALELKDDPSGTVAFKDMENHWAKSIVLTAYKNGLISGYQDLTIRPDNPITIAEVCSVISRAFEYKTVYNGIYDKLKADKWYSSSVKNIFDVGILKTSDMIYNKFNEEAFISRENCAMMVSRALSTY